MCQYTTFSNAIHSFIESSDIKTLNWCILDCKREGVDVAGYFQQWHLTRGIRSSERLCEAIFASIDQKPAANVLSVLMSVKQLVQLSHNTGRLQQVFDLATSNGQLFKRYRTVCVRALKHGDLTNTNIDKFVLQYMKYTFRLRTSETLDDLVALVKSHNLSSNATRLLKEYLNDHRHLEWDALPVTETIAHQTLALCMEQSNFVICSNQNIARTVTITIELLLRCCDRRKPHYINSLVSTIENGLLVTERCTIDVLQNLLKTENHRTSIAKLTRKIFVPSVSPRLLILALQFIRTLLDRGLKIPNIANLARDLLLMETITKPSIYTIDLPELQWYIIRASNANHLSFSLTIREVTRIIHSLCYETATYSDTSNSIQCLYDAQLLAQLYTHGHKFQGLTVELNGALYDHAKEFAQISTLSSEMKSRAALEVVIAMMALPIKCLIKQNSGQNSWSAILALESIKKIASRSPLGVLKNLP
ncbi:hypothetical protein CANCADRAFT_147547 [Tortispora caseinolytica NRRL Y-17796]|uniref:Uncharacterized protein n=1 Tax=Tortispora caseinolytica NRRL Y-17796 TaxID=767744 RepID=A0A1E4TKF8_9ASCO|nr:hypothetical protein CANCADRAFT_147547 [Tortispora caseinolytica NRRL Y-17796]